MKKILLLLMVISIGMLFVGCKKDMKELISENNILFENFPLKVTGTYISSKYYNGEMEEEVRNKEFTGYATDILVEEVSNKTVKVTAIVKNAYFKLKERQTILFQVERNKNELNILDGELKTEDKTIEPTLNFDMDMFYEKEIKLEYQEQVEKSLYNPRGIDIIEIEVTKENIKSIKLDLTGEIGNSKNSSLTNNNFYYNGYCIFELQNGRTYIGHIYLYYMPNEKDDWIEEAKWWIHGADSSSKVYVDDFSKWKDETQSGE